MKRKSPSALRNDCARFNRAYPVGTEVQYFSVLPHDQHPGSAPIRAVVREPAFVLQGHSAVVFLDGVRGCVHIGHVLPVPSPAANAVRNDGARHE